MQDRVSRRSFVEATGCALGLGAAGCASVVHSEAALAGTGRKFLLAQTIYATTHACARADAATYDKLLREVLAAEDPDPSQRLSNIVAKRKAARWLKEKRMFDACSMDPIAPPAEPNPS